MKKWPIIKINLFFLNSKKLIIYYIFFSFDNNKIKTLINYALKFPSSNNKINVEKINNSENYLADKEEEKKIFLTSYKYPYISSEILSHDFPFLLDKLIASNSNTINNIPKINTNTSIILNDLSNKELSFDVEAFMDDNFTKKEKDENFDIFSSVDNPDSNIEMIESDSDLELIDYLLNICFSQELNEVQGGYLIKIFTSLMHSLYSPSKSIYFIKYICYRKNGEILNNMIKKINCFYFQEIIYNFLIYNDEENNFSSYGGIDKKKIYIMSQLINYLKNGVKGIREIFCEYIINSKNEELLINENIFNLFCSEFVYNEESIFDNFCIISSHILKEYKFENCILNNSKSNSKSFMCRTTSAKCVLNNSIISLNLTDKEAIISKFYKIIKNIQLNILCSTTVKINFLTFIFEIMSLTRGNELLNNLKSIKYFLFLKEEFFNTKNDIIQSITINTINLLIQDNTNSNSNTLNKWFYELFINNEFINDALNIKNKSYSNYGLCSESLYIHIGVIFDMLIKNLSEFLSNNNILKKVEQFYNKEFKNYIERMNKSIYEINNSLNLSQYLNKNYENDNELKVDEVADMQSENISSKGAKNLFDLTETSYIKKNSMNLQLKEIISISQDDKFFSNEDDEKVIQSLEKNK